MLDKAELVTHLKNKKKMGKTMRVVCLDIETMGLDPKYKAITTIGLGIHEEKLFASYFVKAPCYEYKALNWLCRKIELYSPCRIVTWRDFDVMFIRSRAAINGIRNPLAGAEFLDLHDCIIGNAMHGKKDIHLVEAADMFGSNIRKIPSTEMPAMYVRWLGGDISAREKIISHCKQDIRMMLGVYDVIASKCKNAQKL